MKTKLTLLNSMFGQEFTVALDKFVEHGLEFVDLKDQIFGKSLVDLTEDETDEAAKAMEIRGLKASCLSSELFYDDIEKGEEHFRLHHLSKVNNLIQIAKRMRPKIIRLLAARSSARETYAYSMDYISKEAPWLIPMYQKAIDQLYAAGFQVTIENECNGCILANPTEIFTFFIKLDRKHKVHFTYDIQNLWEMGTFPSLEIYQLLKPLIGFMHLKGGQVGDQGTSLVWKSTIEDASWPVAEIVTQAVKDHISPIICLNPCHGKMKEGYDYELIAERDVIFVKQLIAAAEKLDDQHKVIGIIGAMDTKGIEFEFLKNEIEKRGHETLIIDTGVMGQPLLLPYITRTEVAQAGGADLADLVAKKDRGEAMKVMAKGAAATVLELYNQGRIQGIIGMGGTAGTSVASNAMRTLPIGFPKLIISTVASGDTREYVGTKDIVMFPAIVDVSGVNRISRDIYTRASGAICGMVEVNITPVEDKPLIAATMFGNTTAAVERSRALIEKAGYEVLVFHCTGTGGQALESLVADGYIRGILDITTTEWADEIVGGVFAAGGNRGDAAAKLGIPQVIVPGCVDMVNFWSRNTVPERYNQRKLYEWNANITLMRTNVEENTQIGTILAEKANASKGPVVFILPLRGVSILDSPGQEFWDPEADKACFDAIKANVKPGISVYEMDCNINDPEFADKAVELLLAMKMVEIKI